MIFDRYRLRDNSRLNLYELLSFPRYHNRHFSFVSTGDCVLRYIVLQFYIVRVISTLSLLDISDDISKTAVQ